MATPDEGEKKPTAAQKTVLSTLNKAFRKDAYHTFLLHGVTGSGKTLVYIEFLKEVLARGKTAIVLVPEIALTPQTAGRFRQHFGDAVTIMHSAMGKQEKYNAWHSLRSGRTKSRSVPVQPFLPRLKTLEPSSLTKSTTEPTSRTGTPATTGVTLPL